MEMAAGSAARPEKRSGPAGLDKVLAQNLIGNLKFPQMALTIALFTMDSIFTDPDCKKLLSKYRQQPVTNAMAKRMREVAHGAHAKHLPPGTAPELSLGRMKRLWKAEKRHIDGFLYHVLAARPGEAPTDTPNFIQTFRLTWALSHGKFEPAVETLSGITGALKKIVSEPEIAEQLQGYRSNFKTPGWKNSPEARTQERAMHAELVRRLRLEVTQDETLDPKVVERAMNFIEQPWD